MQPPNKFLSVILIGIAVIAATQLSNRILIGAPLVFTSELKFAIDSSDVSNELNVCSAVLVPNDLLIAHKNDTDEAFHDAVCGDWYTSHQEASDFATSGAAIIGAVPVEGSASDSSSSKSMTRTQYCSQSNHHVSQATKDTFWSHIVPDKAREDWLSCIDLVSRRSENSVPLRLILKTVDSSNVNLSILWNKNMGGSQPKLKGVESTNLQCKGASSGVSIPFEGNGLVFQCKWTNDDAAIGSVVVHSTRGDEVESCTRTLQPFLTVSCEIHTPTRVKTGTNKVCSQWFATANMDGWEKNGNTDGRCSSSSDDGKWCKGKYGQDVSAQSGGVLNNPRFECRGNLGSCRWNEFGTHSSFTGVGGSLIHGETLAGSNSVDIHLCADEDVYAPQDSVNPGVGSPWTLAKGGGFVVEVPNGSTGVLKLQTPSGTSALSVGDSNDLLSVVSKAGTGTSTEWSYRVKNKP